MTVAIVVIIYIVFCILTGLCGSQRRMGFFGTFNNVTFSHSHCDANRAEINRAIRTRRMASTLAERLTSAALKAASLRSC